MNLKKTLSWFIMLCLALALTLSAAAETAPGGISYAFDASTGTLAVRGSGDMPDYSQGAPWDAQKPQLTRAALEGVTGISSGAFSGCPALDSMLLDPVPATIAPDAFAGSDGVKTLYVTDATQADTLRQLIAGAPVAELADAEIVELNKAELEQLIRDVFDAEAAPAAASAPGKDDDDGGVSDSSTGMRSIAHHSNPVITYDEQGREVKVEQVNRDGSKTVTEMTYDSPEDKTPSRTVATTTDLRGRVVRQVIDAYDENEEEFVTTTIDNIKYDKAGNMTSRDITVVPEDNDYIENGKEVFNADGSSTYTAERVYEDDDTCKIVEDRRPDGQPTQREETWSVEKYGSYKKERTVYDYDGDTLTASHNIETEVLPDGTERETYKSDKTYDVDGNLLTEDTISTYLDDSTRTHHEENVYKDGKLDTRTSTWTDKYPDGSEESSDTVVETFEYDENGNEVAVHTTTTRMDSDMETPETSENDKVTEYDEQNRPVKQTYTYKNSDGDIEKTSVTTYAYGDDGQLKNRTEHIENLNDGETRDASYDYDSEGRQVHYETTETRKDSDGNVIDTEKEVGNTVYVDNEDGTYTEHSTTTRTTGDGEVSKIEDTIVRDGRNGPRLSKTHAEEDGDGNVSSHTTNYDADGNRISESHTDYYADGSSFSHTTNYDADGNKIGESRTDYNADGSSYTKSCTFDPSDEEIVLSEVGEEIGADGSLNAWEKTYNPDGTMLSEEYEEIDPSGKVIQTVEITRVYDEDESGNYRETQHITTESGEKIRVIRYEDGTEEIESEYDVNKPSNEGQTAADVVTMNAIEPDTAEPTEPTETDTGDTLDETTDDTTDDNTDDTVDETTDDTTGDTVDDNTDDTVDGNTDETVDETTDDTTCDTTETPDDSETTEDGNDTTEGGEAAEEVDEANEKDLSEQSAAPRANVRNRRSSSFADRHSRSSDGRRSRGSSSRRSSSRSGGSAGRRN